jgi:hypothetical protein
LKTVFERLDFGANAFDISTARFQNAFSGTFSVAHNGNDFNILYNPVPEPSTGLRIGALGAGVAGLARRRRRRRSAPTEP